MPIISFTEQQRAAIQVTGHSAVVSAAAGSGKTAVLAQRCAYLVCEAPPPARCDVNELLVLTFTDAAAAQMRARIGQALRSKLASHGDGDRLHEQIALVDSAQISTVHSFCLWLVRRWFTQIGIDPSASVLGAEEAALLKREVLDGLFARLFETVGTSIERLGNVDPGARHATAESAPNADLARGFRRLVDDYGLGDERGIADTVLRLFDFTQSLPDPDSWLKGARDFLADRPDRLARTMLVELSDELARQTEHVEQIAAELESGEAVVQFYASELRHYAEQVRSWFQMIEGSDLMMSRQGRTEPAGGTTKPDVERFEAVRASISEFQWSKRRGPSLPRDIEPKIRAIRDAAADQLRLVKQRLFGERLQNRFALYSMDELLEGLSRTAPYVATLTELVSAFESSYSSRKRELNAMDFTDLERFAFALLRHKSDATRPSDVAKTLHDRFKHVLVDEFQDINPLQQAVIQLASRESDASRADNLFVVGDVKQSIYRFRLAEPKIFSDRAARFRENRNGGATLFLQRNYRSRPRILEAVNVLFSALMREGCADVAYDEDARLWPGREEEFPGSCALVECHLLERQWCQAEDEVDLEMEQGVADFARPERWSPIEREAYVIGRRINEWVGHAKPGGSDGSIRYGDIAILLRAAKFNAERIAAMLTKMGIPAYAEVGESLFGSREIRDVVAALRVLDNPRQDIPLAAVLRSGLFGEVMSENELAAIRCLDRDAPFHEVVHQYPGTGEDTALRGRLGGILRRIESYRAAVCCRPLCDMLWRLYHARGYLAYVGGLPNGAQRRANLHKLHQLARQFGTFRRQGLHRFLRFIESLEDDLRGIAAAPAVGAAEDVVRIMSIHQAKGLEFPVVFVAGLGSKFNLGDRNSRMIFERKSGIGLRAVDSDRMIEYPTIAHTRVAEEIARSARYEEMRVLYVAMTRARDRLALVGSVRDVARFEDLGSLPAAGPWPTGLDLEGAITPLDWLIPALRSAAPGVCRRAGHPDERNSLFSIHICGAGEMNRWSAVLRECHQHDVMLAAITRGQELPPDEPLARKDPDVEQVPGRLDYAYPYLVAASVKASMAASESERAVDAAPNLEEQDRQRRPDEFRIPISKYVPRPDDAAYRGTVTHRVLQLLDYARASDEAGVASEMGRIVQAGLISAGDADLVDQSSLSWFVSTPLAESIRSARERFRREFLFTAVEPLGMLDRSVEFPQGDQILVRGIVDGILPVPGGIELIDFKTDAIAPDDLAVRAERYRPQMVVYARAMGRLWRQPVRSCWLVFLAVRRTHVWHDGSWEG